MKKDEQFRIIRSMRNKKDNSAAKIAKPETLEHLSEEQYAEIVKGYELFQLSTLPNYSGVEQFSKQIQKVSNLQFEGLRFFTSGSTLAPKS